ncbi:MAG: SAM-dependent chlorinase/fluorinase [Alphaproteobacteria bacterium]|nr:SAM-dependent chlorinase/fluorinase [Alphaproteobacteria bacterium]
MIVLFTDFGLEGPYVGQMMAVLAREAADVPAVGLFADAPACDPLSAAYLLAAYAPWFESGTVFLCVVDPGVGSRRAAVAVRADGSWFVGPDNGLFEPILRRADKVEAWTIDWRPPTLSATFHGRDLFAPVAARLALGAMPEATPVPVADLRRADWPDDLGAVVYIDRFGNALTGLRASRLGRDAVLEANGHTLSFAGTYSDVPVGASFWYENANGLAEIAVNRGRAADVLGLGVGTPVAVAETGRFVNSMDFIVEC